MIGTDGSLMLELSHHSTRFTLLIFDNINNYTQTNSIIILIIISIILLFELEYLLLYIL